MRGQLSGFIMWGQLQPDAGLNSGLSEGDHHKTCPFITQRDKRSFSCSFFCFTMWSESRSAMSDSLLPDGLYSLWDSPGQNTGVGSCSLLQGIFPMQGLNPDLPQYRQILYQLSHQRSPLYHVNVCNSVQTLPSLCAALWTCEFANCSIIHYSLSHLYWCIEDFRW